MHDYLINQAISTLLFFLQDKEVAKSPKWIKAIKKIRNVTLAILPLGDDEK